MSRIIPVLAAVYRYGVSPVLHTLAGPSGGCRFEPTCGKYAAEAVERHGWMHGSWLVAGRVSRCHPWGGQGVDPVPPNPRVENIKVERRA